MTREEAIKFLKLMRKAVSNFEEYGHDMASMVIECDKAEAIDMAIEALQEVQKHEETFEWCTDCKEYDKDNYCCHRWSKMIRNTVEELKEFSGLVRCKDCRHRVHDEERGLYYCEMYYGQGDVSDENFCQWGERREP